MNWMVGGGGACHCEIVGGAYQKQPALRPPKLQVSHLSLPAIAVPPTSAESFAIVACSFSMVRLSASFSFRSWASACSCFSTLQPHRGVREIQGERWGEGWDA